LTISIAQYESPVCRWRPLKSLESRYVIVFVGFVRFVVPMLFIHFRRRLFRWVNQGLLINYVDEFFQILNLDLGLRAADQLAWKTFVLKRDIARYVIVFIYFVYFILFVCLFVCLFLCFVVSMLFIHFETIGIHWSRQSLTFPVNVRRNWLTPRWCYWCTSLTNVFLCPSLSMSKVCPLNLEISFLWFSGVESKIGKESLPYGAIHAVVTASDVCPLSPTRSLIFSFLRRPGLAVHCWWHQLLKKRKPSERLQRNIVEMEDLARSMLSNISFLLLSIFFSLPVRLEDVASIDLIHLAHCKN
jgi:hypothetical protein